LAILDQPFAGYYIYSTVTMQLNHFPYNAGASNLSSGNLRTAGWANILPELNNKQLSQQKITEAYNY